MAFPSTFLDIQTTVARKARLDLAVAADLQLIKDCINKSYFQVCIETEASVTTTTINMVNGTSKYTLPATVGRIKTIYVTPFGQTLTQPPLVMTTIDDLTNRRLGSGATALSGQWPLYYALLGINDFEVWPTPAAVDVLTVYCAAFPTALSANGDLPIIEEPYASYLLEYGALVQAGDLQGDPATDEWQSNYDTWMQRYLNHLEQKKGDRPDQFHQWGSLADTRALYGGW